METGNEAAMGIGMLVFMVVYLAIAVFYIVAVWKLFAKAGKPGWASIIPIYNAVVMLQIVGRPVWWILLLLIPVVNFVVAIILTMDLAVSFGKDKGWGIVMLFLLGFIGLPILAYGSASYQGPAVKA